jgi:hypothetical protein
VDDIWQERLLRQTTRRSTIFCRNGQARLHQRNDSTAIMVPERESTKQQPL